MQGTAKQHRLNPAKQGAIRDLLTNPEREFGKEGNRN